MDSLISTAIATFGVIVVEITRDFFKDRIKRLDKSQLERCHLKVDQLYRELIKAKSEVVIWQEKYRNLADVQAH